MPNPVFSLPHYRERLLFMGTNGSGKSVLAAQLLARFPTWVAIDPKGDFRVADSDAKILRKPDDWHWAGKMGHYGRPDQIIYRPTEEYDNKLSYNYVLGKLLERGKREGKSNPFIVYIDEMLYLSDVNATQYAKIIAVAGRSLNIGFWASSQRPKGIPVVIRTEAWRWEIFPLMYSEDEKEIERYTKGRLTIEMLQNSEGEDFSFFELKRSKGGKTLTITHFPPLRMP